MVTSCSFISVPPTPLKCSFFFSTLITGSWRKRTAKRKTSLKSYDESLFICLLRILCHHKQGLKMTLQSVRQMVRMTCLGLWAHTQPGGGDLSNIFTMSPSPFFKWKSLLLHFGGNEPNRLFITKGMELRITKRGKPTSFSCVWYCRRCRKRGLSGYPGYLGGRLAGALQVELSTSAQQELSLSKAEQTILRIIIPHKSQKQEKLYCIKWLWFSLHKLQKPFIQNSKHFSKW